MRQQETLEFEIALTNGIIYKIISNRDNIDKLIDLIGENNIDWVEEL